MKRRNMWIARVSAAFLTAVLFGSCPGVALAQESRTELEIQADYTDQTEQNTPTGQTAQESQMDQDGQKEQNDEIDRQTQNSGQGDSEAEKAQKGPESTDTAQTADDKDIQTEDAQTGEAQTDDTTVGENDNQDLPVSGEEELPSDGDSDLPQGGEEQFPSDGETELPTGPITVAVPMNDGEEYDQLSQFLALSSDQFAVYTVAFIDPMTGLPAQPEEAVKVSLAIPAGYDMERVAVSEITMEGQTPVRTELSWVNEDNSAVFQTDHAGLYAVMEKKTQPKLPASLEMTDKVEKLKLTKQLPSALSYTSAYRSNTRNPQTGDDADVMIWVGAAAAAVVIILAAVIIIRKK